jgi:hypothetical protein
VRFSDTEKLTNAIPKDYVVELQFEGTASIEDLTLTEFCNTIQSVQKSAATKLAMPNPKHSVLQST